jgi:hypothetical protein
LYSRRVINDDSSSPAVPAEFTIEFDQLAEWISDVKKIFNEELYEGGKKK